MTEAKFDKLRLGAFLSLIRFNDVATRYTAIEFMRHGSSSMRMMLMNALFLNGGSMSPTELIEAGDIEIRPQRLEGLLAAMGKLKSVSGQFCQRKISMPRKGLGFS